MKEREIQEAIRAALAFDPAVCLWRINPGMAVYGGRKVRTAPTGMSDLIGVCEVETDRGVLGVFMALEVKTPKGKVSDAQARFMASVRVRGGFAAVVRSVDEALEAVRRCKGGGVG